MQTWLKYVAYKNENDLYRELPEFLKGEGYNSLEVEEAKDLAKNENWKYNTNGLSKDVKAVMKIENYEVLVAIFVEDIIVEDTIVKDTIVKAIINKKVGNDFYLKVLERQQDGRWIINNY